VEQELRNEPKQPNHDTKDEDEQKPSTHSQKWIGDGCAAKVFDTLPKEEKDQGA